MIRRAFLTAALALLAASPSSALPAGAARPAAAAQAGATADARWLHFDSPLWDISNEGLPFRFTLSLPSRRDPLTRLLFAREARWTLSAGYAKVYNSYDGATGVFKNPGGHAALLSAGRQFRWHFPPALGAFTPQMAIDFGAHVASRRFPADGTRGNFKLISGLEWTFPRRSGSGAWSVGLMWNHFSNADLLARNSGYDGLALRFGRPLGF